MTYLLSTASTGELCQTNINECASNPCVNGDCIDQVGDYSCHCRLPYTGKNCETEMNPCKPNLCQNNAQCVPSQNYQSFECSCPSGFAGERGISIHSVSYFLEYFEGEIEK